MKKAFTINGGAGRVLCAMPALEHYKKTVDKDLVIIAEAWGELFSLSPELRDNVYHVAHKDLFKTKLLDCEVESPEPYRLNAYFTQKANLIQAFDKLINNLDTVPETKTINLDLGKAEQVYAYNLINQIKSQLNKDKVVVFQPFGSGVKLEGNFVYDTSGRSFELKDVFKIVEELTKQYVVILFSPFKIPTDKPLNAVIPENCDLVKWAAIIKAADYFLGCDSVGQHLAHALNKPTTVVIGATFPENISYPDNKNFTIIDNGKEKRAYSPIRLCHDPLVDRANEDLMILSDDTVAKVIKSVQNKLGKSKKENTTPHVHTAECAHSVSNQNTAVTMPNFQKKPNLLNNIVTNRE
jgi:hypothetical protein